MLDYIDDDIICWKMYVYVENHDEMYVMHVEMYIVENDGINH